jgi:topoisomerase-4 subunit A
MEIRMARILKFNKDKADEAIARMKGEIENIDKDLSNMTEVTCRWFRFIKDKYGKDHPRCTEIRSFDTIEASKVVEANEKLYINRSEGFIGTGLKKDEFVANCSDIDDVILFYKDGTYKIVRVCDKLFVGETERSKAENRKVEILHIAIFKKNDKRTIYNAVYRDGKSGNYYVKRFNVTSMTHDKEYDLTQGKPGSKVLYFTANPNGEAEVIKITLKPNIRLKKILFDFDFSKLAIKGRQSMGNLLSKNDIQRVALKSHGVSTLGGRKVWFDRDVLRLNYDGRGRLLGEFSSDDKILVVLNDGDFYLTDFDINNHYEQNIIVVEKFEIDKVWSAVVSDADNGNFLYVKRFMFAATTRKQNFLGENSDNKLILLSGEVYPRLQVQYGGADAARGTLEIDVEQFIGVKGFKAKGKRLTTFQVAEVKELEPTRFPEKKQDDGTDDDEEPVDDNGDDNNDGPTDGSSGSDDDKSQSDIIDELTGQMRLF